MAPTDKKTEDVSPTEVPEDLPLPSDPKVIFLGGLIIVRMSDETKMLASNTAHLARLLKAQQWGIGGIIVAFVIVYFLFFL
jgi:hypothetical protein